MGHESSFSGGSVVVASKKLSYSDSASESACWSSVDLFFGYEVWISSGAGRDVTWLVFEVRVGVFSDVLAEREVRSSVVLVVCEACGPICDIMFGVCKRNL